MFKTRNAFIRAMLDGRKFLDAQLDMWQWNGTNFLCNGVIVADSSYWLVCTVAEFNSLQGERVVGPAGRNSGQPEANHYQ